MADDAIQADAAFDDATAVSRREAWLFAPLLMVLLGLPVALIAIVSAELWFAAQRLDLGLTQPPPSTTSAAPPLTTFAARWPDASLPTVIR